MKLATQMTKLTVVCANVSKLLFQLNTSGIVLHHVHMIDELTATLYVKQSQYRLTETIIKRAGGETLHSVPATWMLLLKEIRSRPVVVFGVVLILLLTAFLPTRILFIEIIGNERLSSREIVDAAENCGITFWAARHEIRSEKVKNRLLAQLPNLQWVGVNTVGCVAKISVRERSSSNMDTAQPMVTSIVASRDGVIRELLVRNGTPLCRVGQAVKRGQLLVSGYSDCGRCLYGTRADAEIYAQTSREICVKTPTENRKKRYQNGVSRKIGVIVGKKRINFYKGSGISDISCVTMYREYPLTLPGGFQLPLALAVQIEMGYVSEPSERDSGEALTVLHRSARDYLESQMIAGTVSEEDCQITQNDGALCMIGHYVCDEMICQSRNEEILNYYEQTD